MAPLLEFAEWVRTKDPWTAPAVPEHVAFVFNGCSALDRTPSAAARLLIACAMQDVGLVVARGICTLHAP